MGAFQNLMGQRFGRLLVIERADKTDGRVSWLCQCDCGNTKVTSAKLLKNGSSSSCGCLQKERTASARRLLTADLVGTQIGHLLVLQRLNEKKWGSDLFLCRCTACESIKKYTSADLKSGAVIACGCKSALRPKLTIAELEHKLKGMFPSGEVTVDPSSFKSASVVCNFIDKDYGIFKTSPRSLFARKCRHPKFSIQKRGEAKRTTMIGEKIHKLTVNRYVQGTGFVDATCDCGKSVRVKLGDIRSDRIQSCGCLKSEKAAEIIKDYNEKMGFDGIEVGKTYFSLKCVALSDDPQKAIYECECGKKGIIAYRTAVKSGHTSSCGCARSKALKRRMSDPDHALQIATAASRITNMIHWKTGRSIACQGGYEVAVVNWLNREKIDYDWQIVFKMPDGSSYRIDLYLCDIDKFVEIKGFWRTERSKEKWDWFHATYPNSELWMKSELKQQGIL